MARSPDRINDREIKAIRKGFTQGEKSERWIMAQPERVADRIEMSKDDFDKYTIKTIVISRCSTLNGIVRHDNIPLVLESVFRWFLIDRGVTLKPPIGRSAETIIYRAWA